MTFDAAAAAQRRLNEMTREQKIASLLMLHVPGTDPAVVRAFAAAHQPGGLIFMPDNIAPTLSDIAALADAARIDERFPLLIAIDQEGGAVRRVGSDAFASACTLKHRPAVETRAAFRQRAQLLAKAGIAINFGIVADISADTESFIYSRALGETPAESADRVRAAVQGENGTVLSTLKHFPGHGRAAGDSHTSIPQTALDLDTWLNTDAVPFAAGIAAGAELVMVGHLVYSTVDSAPATLSGVWHRILRTRLGFDGIIVTDDLLMLRDSGVPEYRHASENAIRALAAGATMLLYVLRGSPETDGTDAATLITDISAAVSVGRLSDDLINDAALRLLEFRARQA